MNAQREACIWQITGQNVFQKIWRKKKGRFITCVGDTKLGRKDDIIHDNISIPKRLAELE